MVVRSKERPRAETSFNLPLEPAGPFWVLEYVSKSNKRKDYEDNFDKYEIELKVPYYLIFYPEIQELTLYRHDGTKYVTVPPNEHGRYPIPEVKIEVALLDGWVRYWFEGELLPLPAELQRDLDEAKRQAERERERAEQEKRRAEEERERAERERERAEQERRRGDDLQRSLAELESELKKLRDPSGGQEPRGS
jgi:hypothetical protein